MRLASKLDRYPAKMVSKLADRLIERYASEAGSVLDPFCGSGAILVAAKRAGLSGLWSGFESNRRVVLSREGWRIRFRSCSRAWRCLDSGGPDGDTADAGRLEWGELLVYTRNFKEICTIEGSK